jgi:hypothetical protein
MQMMKGTTYVDVLRRLPTQARTLAYSSGGMSPLHSAKEMATPLPLQGRVGTPAACAKIVDPTFKSAVVCRGVVMFVSLGTAHHL